MRVDGDVWLKSVWVGELAPGVGDKDALYCKFGFSSKSATFDAIKAGRCDGFSFSGPVSYAS